MKDISDVVADGRFFRRRVGAFTLAGIFAVAALGCSFVPDYQRLKLNPFDRHKPPAVPDRMMVLWTDTVLHQPQQPGVRGFGGRVYFYQGDGARPITVDGGLVVYAFDGDDLSMDATRPEKKYVFTADHLPEHMSHTDMGPSYSIWLPWDEVGGPNRRLSLVARFEGREGGVVISKPTVKLLPGIGPYAKPKSDPIGLAATAAHPGTGVLRAAAADSPDAVTGRPQVALVGHESVAGDGAASASRRPSAMTIDLPPSFRRHLAGEGRESDSGRDDGVTTGDGRPPDIFQPKPATAGASRDDGPASAGRSAPAGDDETSRGEGPKSSATETNAVGIPLQSRRHTFRQPASAGRYPTQSEDAVRRPAGWMEPPPKRR